MKEESCDGPAIVYNIVVYYYVSQQLNFVGGVCIVNPALRIKNLRVVVVVCIREEIFTIFLNRYINPHCCCIKQAKSAD